MSPYYYPWIFDRQLMKENLAELATMPFQLKMTSKTQDSRLVLVEAQQLFNVRVNIVGYLEVPAGCGKVNFNSSFEHVEEFPLSISAYCLVITWEVIDANAEQTALRKYTLTEETPTFVIHGDRVMPQESLLS
ncbi:unnamed protein product, partial [Mesorhabditis belari]|uniref:Uncharacterized protein n=1 Tax=Mesorhabditis belari TaxID=2138241 RepID=A0AAF3EX54_9BILA